MAILDINEIRRILPHRYPFLLVDRIVELEAERIVGIKKCRPIRGRPSPRWAHGRREDRCGCG